MAAGLQSLRDYPFGCTEQQLSRTRALVSLRAFREVLGVAGDDADIKRAVADTQRYIGSAMDSDGLVAFWPGSRGIVSLTAWSLQLLVEAREAGIPTDAGLEEKLAQAVTRSLRSDFGRFLDGESWAERAWALTALADAGRVDAAYAAELSRKTQHLDTEGKAQALNALVRSKQGESAAARSLAAATWEGIVIRLHQGAEIYGGLQQGRTRSGLILPSETRTVAQVLRSLLRARADEARLPLLKDALVTLGRGDGWGSTNADAEALLALADVLKPPYAKPTAGTAEVGMGGDAIKITIDAARPTRTWISTRPDAGRISLTSGGPLVARLETSWIPDGDGSSVAADQQGFVVSREVLLVHGDGEPADRIALDAPGKTITLAVGDVVEEHVRVVNPAARSHVAVVVPMAAGLEPLNPALATAPPESRPKGTTASDVTYRQVLDDSASFFCNELPAGTYDFYFRARATVAGTFVQPAASAELMYDGAVRGNSHGARVVVRR